MSKFLPTKAKYLSKANCQGKLFLIDHYPSVISSEKPENQVLGERFEMTDKTVLKKLDHFEGIGNEYSEPYEYRRELPKILLNDGKRIDAWIYLYNWYLEWKKEILSGDLFSEQH